MICPQSEREEPSNARPASRLSPTLDKSLLAYVAVASAAGIGAAASAIPVEAKVVYTPANQSIGTATFLDLNNDGIADFKFRDTHSVLCQGCTTTGSRIRHGTRFDSSHGKLAIYGGRNQIWGSGKYASALGPGILVGPAGKFPGGNVMVSADDINSYTFDLGAYGPWKGNSFGTSSIKNHYVGLKFVIKGEIHFGWARLDVTISRGAVITATLTGYAYETVAKRPIVTGETHGPAEVGRNSNQALPDSTPPSLGQLAAGAQALSAWRKK
jgi:hypothetical protein